MVDVAQSLELGSSATCWLCGQHTLVTVRESSLPQDISKDNFKISNSDYGVTASIDRCSNCGFHQCTDMMDVLQFYEDMDDPGYEETREQRALQERALLKCLPQPTASKPLRLLDVGAGSGILVEEALEMGFDAIGVEPSQSLQETANDLGIPVLKGVLPHPEISGKFDLITIVDVIEHVPDPVGLIATAAELLSENGTLIVVTPDRLSLVARLMGRRWWHYRVAHIGYFDPKTLNFALERANLRQTEFRRPTWYFPINYLVERTLSYFPKWMRFKFPDFIGQLVVPLNLRDSMIVGAQKISKD
ncbi:class I SAM-dependent methyltransferase [Roseibium sp. RKSG952]|nr:class I SAM-dependent methyltransferase [Roseibium sp. RKSG952]